MTYTIGSLFAGIGGFDLGFERAGFKTSWQVEIDPYCTKVLAKNFPEAERFGDIRECGSHNLKPVDVICGGFPCQDISNAGLRAGITGERSGLWTEYARIIRELRPRFVVVENVAALLGRGMGVVLGDLAAIGYDAEWKIISAADIGAPHIRERVWIVAHSERSRRRKPSGYLAAIQESLCSPKRAKGALITRPSRKNLADSVLEGLPLTRHTRRISQASSGIEPRATLDGNGWWAVEPNVGRVAHGVPRRVDRLRGLGNAVVPQIPEMIARHIKRALDSK